MNIFENNQKDLKTVSREVIDGKNYLVVDNIQGSIMCLPRHDYGMLWGMLFYGESEPKGTEFVKKVVKPGMICADVGAFVGYYGLLMAKLAGKEGRVHLFEPLTESFLSCLASVKKNDYSCILHNEIVSDIEGWANIDSETMFAGNSWGSERHVTTLDLAIASKMDFVKIDTEGYDCKVMEGMSELINDNKNIVIMSEYCPDLWIRQKIYPSDLVNFIRGHDLIASVLTESGELEDFEQEKYLKPPIKWGVDGEALIWEKLYTETLVIARKHRMLELKQLG